MDTIVSHQEQAALDRDDANIEFVAIALCWDARPSLPVGKVDQYAWWRMQSELEQRKFIRRARIAADAWEEANARDW